MIEPLLLSTTRISTFAGAEPLTSATGFYFERENRLYLVSSRHVMLDEPSEHRPDRIEIEVHTDAADMTATACVSILLYCAGKAVWHEASDTGGPIDVAVIALDPQAFPSDASIRPFRPEHLVRCLDDVRVGAPLLIPGYPLGFHDTLHHLPVVRQACVASAFGVRFQGQGCFLTDSRTHRGSSGAPVVTAPAPGDDATQFRLVGVHSSRLDMRNRDLRADESLGLNSAWYADVVMVLTAPAAAVVEDETSR